MKQFFFIAALITISLSSIAQDRILTLEQAVSGQIRELSPLNIRNTQWRGKSPNFTFQDYSAIYQQSATKADSVVLLTIADLNSSLLKAGGDSVRSIPYIKWENDDEFHFFIGSSWYAYSITEKKIIASILLPNGAENYSLNYSKKLIAFTIQNNLYVVGTNNKIIAITSDSDKNIVNGQTVSRNEFGIDRGIFWSPNGSYIGFYCKDEHKVTEYPLVDIVPHQATLKLIKYPMAGNPSENVCLGIYNLATNTNIFVEKNDTLSEKYLTNISWDPDEQFVYIQVLNHEQNKMKLNKYSVTDGKLVKTLFEEQNNKYVEPLYPIMFLPDNEEKFIYQSRRDGYNHAYLYDTVGNLLNQVTKGSFEITNLIYVGRQYIYYESTEPSPLERHFYKAELKTGKKSLLTTVGGTHSVEFNTGESYFIDTYSNIHIPNSIDVVSVKGKKVRNVLNAANPLKDYNMPAIQMGTIKAADGKTDLYYRLIKPINFDSLKKYPVIVYVYGGPHAQLVEDSWLGGTQMWEYFMAQKGYILFTVDNRGSANRGLEFENVIHRQCGRNEMKDQMEGIKFLKTLGYADMNRVGVHGWSYGGFMTISLMVNYPDVFKVGVAGGPVIDWSFYEVMYGERYMDTPAENPQGYITTSLLPRAKDLKGKLLIIHGAMDSTVVWQNSQLFLNECIKKQVPVDYFVYPIAEHNMRGYDRVHLMQKVTNYFDDYLIK